MKFKSLVPVLFAVVFAAGCYTNKKKEENFVNDKFTLSGTCPTRADENKLRKQTARQMLDSKKIPSVDFEFDSTIMVPSAYGTLDKLAEILTTNRNFKLIVEGHTDEVGSNEYNDWLSNARANAVKSYLISRDVYTDAIKTYGHGKRAPLVNDDSPDGRACNRRVVFTITTRHWNTVY